VRRVPHRLQDSFYRAQFEAPVAGIAVADLASLTIIAANNRMLEILGRTREEIEGIPKVWVDLTPSKYHALEERTLT
jgi:PAS domain-containing protein